MAVREILTVPNALLKQRSKSLDAVTNETRALMDDMLETMYAAPGIGLAAIQIGEPVRVIVMDLGDRTLEGGRPEGTEADDVVNRNPRFFVNPEVVEASEDKQVYEEGCLSVPEIYDEVERPSRVKLRYLNYQGEQVEEWAEGLYAICIQHEMDHLNGVLFIDHLSRLKRTRAVEKVKKAKERAASEAM